jgi:hypothetical protein
MNDYRTISVSSLLSKYGTMTGIKTTTIIFFKFKTFDEFYEWIDVIDEDNRVHVYCHNDLFEGEIIGVDKEAQEISLFKHVPENWNSMEFITLKCKNSGDFIGSLNFKITPYKRCVPSMTEIQNFTCFGGLEFTSEFKPISGQPIPNPSKTDS